MHATPSMKLPTLAGFPPSELPFPNPLISNPTVTTFSPADEQENMASAQSDESEPPLKKVRTSTPPTQDAFQPFPTMAVQDSHKPGVRPFNSQITVSNDIQALQGLQREPYLGGSISTSNDSVTSTSFTSFEAGKSSTPPTTPAQSLPMSSSSTGVSVLESKKIDLSKCRPRSSIPPKLKPAVYGQQCVAAAWSSRLNPYALHEKEQEALQDHLCHLHVTLYLNIRNGILRLWTRNPMVGVTREEALGCAKDYRWMNLASFAFDWLARSGYINFGCVEVPMPFVPPRRGRRKEGPVILVVGAGVGGLGCARQLEGLFRHYRDSDTAPRVIVIEGRQRIGGRVYSHPLQSLKSRMLPKGLVPKVEMGAQIIVGFDYGNPLDAIVRGQLALHYHFLRDISTIYDVDGSPVHELQDAMANKLHNDVLERTGLYRHQKTVKTTAEGDQDRIDNGKESTSDDGLTVRQWEDARAAGTTDLLVPTKRVRRRHGVGHKTADIKPTNNTVMELEGPSKEYPAALAAQAMGWKLNPGFSAHDTLDLDPIVSASKAQTLGAVMDEGIKQYEAMLPLTPKDMRLLNWHLANLEYANASNIDKLSLSGWDMDYGNEFDGEHSSVIGGYQQLPYGLYSLPTKLDVRTNKIVHNITYDATGSENKKAVVQCADGDTFTADHVVFTGSLGTLKHQTIQFSPPLPDWKQGAIERLGFGVMNKVVLVFDAPFWDTERDMFGLLREPTSFESMDQKDYATNRGRFYLFWNCIKTTGLPTLVALMAGDAAHQTEIMPDAEIIAEVLSQLRNVFKHAAVPDPLETIVTRWASDPFTRGSYSYVAAGALPEDYDLMARKVGNLHFAGEATCGTHPATVHGAYLSGLRAASEIIEDVIGPIEIPVPLVPEKPSTSLTATPASTSSSAPKRAAPTSSSRDPNIGEKQRRATYDQAMWAAIYAELGPTPTCPPKVGRNPFLLYQKDFWNTCKEQCDNARRVATNNPNAKASRDDVRAALGLMWRNAAQAEKQPYIDRVDNTRQQHEVAFGAFQIAANEWNRRSFEVKDRWCAENPYEGWKTPEEASTA
ncbi:hypothetical protein N7462_007836 [Penicillium macrosclerotiorum]|uniref:uncharacterized protein n=1 Tax=Penicillium macrosclerotiorum TaxID=303699 RepID=UPI0025491A5F|nr:uncharacterized protein N7462_007836 [Penicillium macrosclerotiorum]KAJ5679592.1 hypothetical protein N7462_007836 [Penicillium macrosclerotiorum]